MDDAEGAGKMKPREWKGWDSPCRTLRLINSLTCDARVRELWTDNSSMALALLVSALAPWRVSVWGWCL